MKRLMLLLVMLLLCSSACAEQQAPADALHPMLEAHPGYAVMSCDQWGDTVAAVLAMDEKRLLCLAERLNGAWTLTIDNPTALPPGADVSLFLDTDCSLFWSISDGSALEPSTWHYIAFRGTKGWGQVYCIYMHHTPQQTIYQTSYDWQEGGLHIVREHRDENENLLNRRLCAVIPAAWLEEYLQLETYDASIVPIPQAREYPGSWLKEDTLRRCLEELAPGYTYVGGGATDDGLELLARDPRGQLRMVTSRCVDDTPVTNVSSPLPGDTFFGYENFWDCVSMDGLPAAALISRADGVWGVDYTWPTSPDGEILHYGRNWIGGEGNVFYDQIYVGDHPWSDISAIDWSTLPSTMEEALEQLDPGRWAVVNNPDPADRLHLRERADKGSRSFGKYYNGTPVEVLEKGKTWTRVRIQGQNGWMMTRYLAFGKDAWKVANAFPQLHLSETGTSFPVWREERLHTGDFCPEGDWILETNTDYCIIGLIGNEYFHVWFPQEDRGGIMRRSDFWSGNG